MKKVLFIANTIYQVMVSIYIKECFFKEDVADVFVCSETEHLNELIRAKKLNSFFREVVLVEYKKLEKFESQKGVLGHMNHLHRIWSPEWFLKGMGCELELEYDDLFFYVPGRCFKDLYKAIKQKNEFVKLHCYQHGVETYLGSKCILGMVKGKDTIIDRFYELINQIKFGFDIENLEYDIYCFSCKLMPKDEPKICIEIPNDRWSGDITHRMNEAFNYKLDCSYKISEKFIFFEQASEYILDNEKYFSFINNICKLVGNDNLIIKKHPRMKLPIMKDFHIYPGKEAWEEYLMNNDVSDKVLITVSSTAVATAKYMFNQNCKIVYCYKIIGDVMSEEVLRYTSFLEETKEKYKNVYIPNDIDELRDVLIRA